jgi:hypothetical protein
LANNTEFKATEKRPNYLINDVLATFINDGLSPHLIHMLPEVYALVSSEAGRLSFSQQLKALTEQKEFDKFCNLNQLIKDRHIAFMQGIAGKTISPQYQKCLVLGNKIYNDLYDKLFAKTRDFLQTYKASLVSGMHLLEQGNCSNAALQQCLDKALVTINMHVKDMIDTYQNYRLADKEAVVINIINGKPLVTSGLCSTGHTSRLQPAARLVTTKELFSEASFTDSVQKRQVQHRHRFFSANAKVFAAPKVEPASSSNVRFKYRSR